MYDTIIGSTGPASANAALFAAKTGKKTLSAIMIRNDVKSFAKSS